MLNQIINDDFNSDQNLVGDSSSLESALLTLNSLTRTFNVRRGLLGEQAKLTAVNNVEFNLKKGEILGLVGESGCGKSTLGRMLAGLLCPSSGQVLIEGQSLYSAKGQANLDGSIQMIFQDPYASLNPRLPIGLSIAEPLTVQGMPKAKRVERVHEMLKLVGFFPEHAHRYPHEFSGGQRQRIAVARALITEPKLLICDEPVSALDASVQAQILNLICQIHEEFNPSCVFISHDLAVVGFVCPRIAVMYLGNIVEDAPRTNLFQNPAHPYTKALLASIPSHEPDNRLQTSPLKGELPSPLNLPLGCSFHPRCPQAMDICKQAVPKLTQVNPNHHVRCHLFSG